MATYRKSRAFAPEGSFECEGRGLEWLGAAHAQDDPRMVQVCSWGKDYLDIERVGSAFPTPQAARAFGAALAHMHDAGVGYFGSAPDGYNGICYFGPLQDPAKMDTGEWVDSISYFADGRLHLMINLSVRRGELDKRDVELTERVIEALPDLMGRATVDKPAHIHGDLRSGNVMWTTDSGQSEAVPIDPAAHGGHRKENLAMLHLFGMSHLSEITKGYQSVHPLKAGRQERIALWQLYPIAGHCVFFGGGYVNEYRSMCRSLLK